MSTQNHDIAIIGAGSWGTAVAIHLAQAGHAVTLWGHKPIHVKALKQDRQNKQFLPNIPFPDTLHITDNLIDAVQHSKEIILAVPSHAFNEVLSQLPRQTLQNGVAWLTKGLEPKQRILLHQLIKQYAGTQIPFAIISGPSFAMEVAKQLPTAITIAGNQKAYSLRLQALFHYKNFRVYFCPDHIGVQIAGAVKNVLAIATGISDGLGYGANARAALITRGLAEMARLGEAIGADKSTFMGLAGVGDLVLTCTDNQSRNRRFGLLLGEGNSFEQAQTIIGQVVEGRFNASQVNELASEHNVDMPITQMVAAILDKQLSAKEAVETLLARPATQE